MKIFRVKDCPLKSIYYLPFGVTFYKDTKCEEMWEPGIYVNEADPSTDEQLLLLFERKTTEGRDLSERMGFEKGQATG